MVCAEQTRFQINIMNQFKNIYSLFATMLMISALGACNSNQPLGFSPTVGPIPIVTESNRISLTVLPSGTPTIATNTPTKSAVTETSTPSVNLISETDSSPSPSPTMTTTPRLTALPSKYQPMLSDIALNFAEYRNPLYVCVDANNLGQIWLSHSPFDSPYRIIASNVNAFYEPAWSKDGSMVAFVVVGTENPIETEQLNGKWLQYTDTIWIAREDAQDFVKFDLGVARDEFESYETGSCTVTGGIVSLVGFSPDNVWLAYSVKNSREQGFNSLYVVNIENGNVSHITDNFGYAVWLPESPELVVTSESVDSQIRLISPADEEVISNTIVLPPASLRTNQIVTAVYPNSKGDKLFVFVDDTSSYLAPTTLWEANIKTGEWQEIEEIDLSGRSGIKAATVDDSLVVCSRQDGSRVVEIINAETWETQQVANNKDIVCIITAQLDGNNVPTITYVLSSSEGQSIWSTSMYDAQLISQVIIDAKVLIPPGSLRTIASYTWRAVFP